MREDEAIFRIEVGKSKRAGWKDRKALLLSRSCEFMRTLDTE